MLKWVVLGRNEMVQVKCVYTILPMKMVYRHDIKWRQMHRPTHTSRMLGMLVSANSAKLQYLHGNWFNVACVPHLSGAGWSGLPWDMSPIVSDVAIPDSSEAVGSLSTDGTGAEVLDCLTLPQGHHPWPALSWGWWVANSFYVGSGCTPPHPWGISHRLVHWDRAIFPPHILYFPISFVFYGSSWRQLHRLGPCPQPPRPCFTCHSLVYGAVPLAWNDLAFLWTLCTHSLSFCTNFEVVGAVTECGTNLRATSTGRWGCLPYMR